jgi:hypothetical protein
VMAVVRRRRYLVSFEIPFSEVPEYQAAARARLEACPEAASPTDEQVEDFLLAAFYLDAIDMDVLLPNLRRARIAFPPELAVDRYRLGCYILHRWNDPAIREPFLQTAMEHNWEALAKIKRTRDMRLLLSCVREINAPGTFALLRRNSMADLIEPLRAALPEHQLTTYETLLLFGRLTMHRFVTEPEPPRRPSRWEKQKLEQRLRLRDVQVRSLRRNLVKLRREGRRLLSHVREAGRRDPQLDVLARELAQIRTQAAEAERRHAGALAAQAGRCRVEMDALQAALDAAVREHRETLAVRGTWLPAGGDGA